MAGNPVAIDFGNIKQAADLGAELHTAIGQRIYQARLADLDQQANSGKVTLPDGTTADANSAAGQQALTAARIDAYKKASWWGVGHSQNPDGDQSLNNMLQGDRTEQGAQQGSRGALNVANAPQVADPMVGNGATKADPNAVAAGYRQQAIGGALAGQFQQSNANNEMASTVQNTAASQPIQVNSPQFQNMDAGQRMQDQQTGVMGATASAGAQYGDAQRVSSGTQAYLNSTSGLLATTAGKMSQQIGSGDMVGATGSLNAMASLNPGLLPQGADPHIPFQYDPANHAFVVRAPNNQPVLGPDGKAQMLPVDAVAQSAPFLAQSPDKIPGILMGLHGQRIQAMLQAQAKGADAQRQVYSANPQSGMGFMLRAFDEASAGGGAGTGGAGGGLAKQLSSMGIAVTNKQGGGSSSMNGSGQLVTQIVYRNGQSGTLVTTPAKANPDGTMSPTTTQFLDNNGRVISGVIPGTTTAAQSASGNLGSLLDTMMKYKDIGSNKIDAITAEQVRGINGVGNINLGLPFGSPQTSALPSGQGGGQASAPGDPSTGTIKDVSDSLQFSPKSASQYSLLTKNWVGTPYEMPTSLPGIALHMESGDTDVPTRQLKNGVSVTGAAQLTPETAKPYFDQLKAANLLPGHITSLTQALNDPATNRVIGAAVLQDNYGAFAKLGMTPANTVTATLAAYNMGKAAAVAWVHGLPYRTQGGKLWKPSGPMDPNGLPPETQKYIQQGKNLLAARLSGPGAGQGATPPAPSDPAASTAANATAAATAAPNPNLALPGMGATNWTMPPPVQAATATN